MLHWVIVLFYCVAVERIFLNLLRIMNIEELFYLGIAHPVLYNINDEDYIIHFNIYVSFFHIFVVVKAEQLNLHPQIRILNQEKTPC